MITPEEFPYITSIHVNDCYAYQNFDIPLFDYKPEKPFSHLILTGKNGSGKSTILRSLNGYFVGWRMDNLPYTENQNLIQHIFDLEQLVKSRSVTHGLQDGIVHAWQNELKKFTTLTIFTSFDSDLIWKQNKNTLLYSYFQAERNGKVDKVEAPSKETEFSAKLNSPDSTEFFVRKFKQYLVNQKVEQAFSQIENQASQIEWVSQFFKKIEDTFRKMFADDAVSLEFIRSDYEFYIKLSNDRRVTFDTLSDGFSALLSIVMDLFTRVNLICKQANDFTYDPCGIVLIDEPETHLHLQLQEQVLPLLTNLFPNIQFIVATHSPAVVA
ncbi:MAG: ATP-binding protein, partial [Rudanella sp.]|nr:ATP-binding protein [Rudanella sp.]